MIKKKKFKNSKESVCVCAYVCECVGGVCFSIYNSKLQDKSIVLQKCQNLLLWLFSAKMNITGTWSAC